MLDNDGSWTLPNTEFKEWFSAEDLWDGFTTAYGAVAPGSYESQIDSLRSCGAPTMRDQMDGAIRFLRLMSEVEPLMRQVNKILNDLRAKDNEIKQLWDKYYAACQRHAQCKKIPANLCEAMPPAQ